jgi:hypothetical protein
MLMTMVLGYSFMFGPNDFIVWSNIIIDIRSLGRAHLCVPLPSQQ